MHRPTEDIRRLSARDADALLSELCVRLGFCLPPAARARLRDEPPGDVTTFVAAVFLSEGLDPSTADRNLYRSVTAMVTDAFRRHEERQDDEEG